MTGTEVQQLLRQAVTNKELVQERCGGEKMPNRG
jgi:hypothetical protein